MTRFLSRSSGFTLVELAMVLFIVSLLIGGLLMPLSAQNEVRGRQETDRALATIREALIGFAAINGRLPCPADRTIASGVANAGVEATTVAGGPCACTAAASGIANVGGAICDDDAPGGVTGVLPWATLGLSEGDAWGNRYTYRVSTRFARLASGQTIFGGACAPTSNPAAAAFALCSAGNMSVKTVAGGTDIATLVPVVVLSHGRNTLGAYMSNGTQVAGAVNDEAENANGDANFVSNNNLDDQLTWLPTSILMGRMLSAGRLP